MYAIYITISYNIMPSFNYNWFFLITNDTDNISKKNPFYPKYLTTFN